MAICCLFQVANPTSLCVCVPSIRGQIDLLNNASMQWMLPALHSAQLLPFVLRYLFGLSLQKGLPSGRQDALPKCRKLCYIRSFVFG